MKKILSIVLSLTLVVGLLVGMPAAPAKADIISNVSPRDGDAVNLLSDDVYEFCANYRRGLVNSLYKRGRDTYQPTPVVFTWDEAPDTFTYKLRLSEGNKLQDIVNYDTPTNKVKVEDLLPGSDYCYYVRSWAGWSVFISNTIHFRTTNLPRTIEVGKVGNTRDIGGCYVDGGKQRVLLGKVIRGARLDEISDAGKQKLLGTYGIKTDLDLREESKTPKQSPLGETVSFISISAPQYLGKPSYKNEIGGFDYEPAWPIIKKELEVFSDANNYPIYVHSDTGRDRTGSIVILLESLLGMSEDEIYRDYELSYFANVSNISVVDPIAANVSTIDALVEYLKNYSTGSLQQNAEKYMKNAIGMTDNQIASIKNNLLSTLPQPTPKPTPKYSVKTPGKVEIKSVKNVKRKTVVIKYRKTTNTKGYQVWCARSKKFEKAKKTKYTTKTTYKFKKLKKKKKYYIRVRAYNINGHTKVFGPYSKTKKVKIRK